MKEAQPFDPAINVGDQFEALGTRLEITAIEGNNLVCKNLNHNGRPFTIPRQQMKMILAEARFRSQLTDQEIRDIEADAEEESA